MGLYGCVYWHDMKTIKWVWNTHWAELSGVYGAKLYVKNGWRLFGRCYCHRCYCCRVSLNRPILLFYLSLFLRSCNLPFFQLVKSSNKISTIQTIEYWISEINTINCWKWQQRHNRNAVQNKKKERKKQTTKCFRRKRERERDAQTVPCECLKLWIIESARTDWISHRCLFICLLFCVHSSHFRFHSLTELRLSKWQFNTKDV